MSFYRSKNLLNEPAVASLIGCTSTFVVRVSIMLLILCVPLGGHAGNSLLGEVLH